MTFEMMCQTKKLQLSHLVEYWLDQIQYWSTIAIRGEHWKSNTTSIADVSCNERIEFVSFKIEELTGYSL